MKMERRIGVVLLLHIVALTVASNETISITDSAIISTQHPVAVPNTNATAALNKTDSISTEATVTVPEVGMPLSNVTLDMLYKPAQGDGTNKKSVPKKGIKDTVKPRKGAELPNELQAIHVTSNPTLKFKPLASETQSTEDEVSVQPDYTALIVGLSLGIALVLILASVTYWRLRDVWERRQYKRVDFLIDGLYTDT